ncbi:MAG: PhnD/SsuA/transferrin family substrate-binding protein [Proteobacteria bacterium]|jgi:rhodanese-related sulfurtransferase|nr:PhnD/SsuA/transferrin family substrate-binding protein [Pseudomonadota bacterium]
MKHEPLHAALALALLAAVAPALADLSAVVVSEPTSRKDGLMVSRQGLEAGLAKASGRNVKVTLSEDLTDAMRATRSKGYDIFIAPAQVAASALAHGYELVGATSAEEHYLLVGAGTRGSAAQLAGARIYLPQQDSIYTYLARGMLTSAGLSFKDLAQVEYARYPQAGLTAISLRLADATVIRQADWDDWTKAHPGVAKVLATSGGVPGGFSVVVNRELPADLRARVAKWFHDSAGGVGMKPVALLPEATLYKRVAELGTFTPTSLPGAKVVGAEQVAKLIGEGAVVVDTRNEQEYKARHIPGALFVPYHEKSLKDVAYDAALDDFSGLARLDPKRPTVFHCNGAECWKSYKAARAALAKGFAQVYWFRGGMPEWLEARRQVAQD